WNSRLAAAGSPQRPRLRAARRLGVKPEHIFVEKASGVCNDRPQLAEALAVLEKSDTLACFKLDRIGRSLPHLISLLEDLEKRGVHFMTTEDGRVRSNIRARSKAATAAMMLRTNLPDAGSATRNATGRRGAGPKAARRERAQLARNRRDVQSQPCNDVSGAAAGAGA